MRVVWLLGLLHPKCEKVTPERSYDSDDSEYHFISGYINIGDIEVNANSS